MAEILFDKEFPELLQPQIETILNDFAWLSPLWLQRLYVGYTPKNVDDAATMHTDKDYRFARLTICPRLLDTHQKIIREDLVHELIHTFISPLKSYFLEVVDEICPESENAALNKIIKMEVRAKNEAITQDFAFAIYKQFYKPE